MTTQAGSGIEGMKAERLGGSGFDDFPNIQIHAQAEHLKLVDQSDVDAAVNILQQLGHLGRGGRGDGNGAMEDRTVESASQLRGLRIQSANDLGNVAAGNRGVARIFAFGRKSRKELLSPLSAGRSSAGSLQPVLVFFLQNRQHDFFRGAGVSCTLENHQLPGLQMGRDGVCGIGDEAEIGFVILVKRSGDADDDGVHLSDPGVFGCGRKALLLGFSDLFRGDAVDVGFTLSEGIDLALIDVEAGHGELLFAEQQGQRQSNVAEADDADPRLTLLDLVFELIVTWPAGGPFCGRMLLHLRDWWSLSWLNFIFDSSMWLGDECP